MTDPMAEDDQKQPRKAADGLPVTESTIPPIAEDELENKVREIIHRTDDVFFFAANHNYKWTGGDLVPEIMQLCNAYTTNKIIEELERYLEKADPNYIDYAYIKQRIKALNHRKDD